MTIPVIKNISPVTSIGNDQDPAIAEPSTIIVTSTLKDGFVTILEEVETMFAKDSVVKVYDDEEPPSVTVNQKNQSTTV